MKNKIWIFIPVISFLFLHRMILFSEMPMANDLVAHKPIAEWSENVDKSDGFPQWFPNLFSGMPSYGGYIYMPADPTKPIINTIFFNRGLKIWFYLTLGSLGLFIFLRQMKISSIPALIGGVASGLTPYSFGLINAGHLNKIFAMAFIPWVLWAAINLSHKINLKAILTLALVTALQLWVNHPQIVYYTWMVIGFYWVWEFGASIKEKTNPLSKNVKHLGSMLAGLALALLMVSDPYVDILKFQKHSNRGAKSVLDQTGQTESGTDWNYATQWSFHPKETISFIYPYFFGLQNFSTRDIKSAAYWGYMPFTQSTHFLGLVVILFAILGALLRKPDKLEWFFWSVTLITLITGFGSYFPILFEPFYSFFPFFSKFRIPSMIYVLLAVSFPVLGAKGIDTFLSKMGEKETLKKTGIVFGSIAGLSILLLFFGESFVEFSTAKDGRYNPAIIAQLKTARIELFNKGLLLAFFISAGSGALCWALIHQKVSKTLFGFLLLGFTVVELGIVNIEFLHLKPENNMDLQFRPNPVVDYLKNDNSHFRIFPADEISSNRYSYWNLESIGGYRPIKLRNYQDFMDGTKSLSGRSQLPFIARPKLLDMLNVKYILTGKKINSSTFQKVEGVNGLYKNTHVLPKAWFVQSVRSVDSQRASLMETLLPKFDPSSEAVVVDYNGEHSNQFVTGSIEVVSKQENNIILKTESETGGLMVLSEIYYKPGWQAFIDGKETPIYQTNHILRSVDVPSGAHKVTFEYDDSGWQRTRLISRASFGLILFGLCLLFWKEPKKTSEIS